MSLSLEPFLITQELLYKQLALLFPADEIHFNTKKTTNVKYPSGNYMEFDIWIPSHNLCFEFQDSYHYMTTWYYQNTQGFIQEMDNMKSVMARQQGYCLIAVPLWWDGSQEQLANTITFYRPDLNVETDLAGEVIHLTPPEFYQEEALVPHIGQLMLASFPLFKVNLSTETWWLGEKYDGIRCCWDPIDLTAYTRYGKEIPLLPEFIQYMPSIFLDSELWLGRGRYSTFALNGMPHSSWTDLRAICFDIPSVDLQLESYETRYTRLIFCLTPDHLFCNLAIRTRYVRKKLGLFAEWVIDQGGEGIILQKHNSTYERGRSQNVLKIKTTEVDQEGIIVEIAANKSVSLLLPQGMKINVPSEDVLIPMPKVGDIVTFSFDANSRRDAPTNPKIFRVRTDVVWEDLVREKQRSDVNVFTTKPQGFWTPQNMRAYMEQFAKHRHLDPLVPDTWLTSFTEFVQTPSSRAILGKFKNGYLQALQQLFPEVAFDPSQFQQAYYKVENRRKFFENYARENDFDPLVPDNWYSQINNKIMSVKGAPRVITYHGNSIAKALLDLFPNIGLEKSKLRDPEGFWEHSKNRRDFFENFARRQGFDPLIPRNWYSFSKSRIMSTQGIHTILAFHNYNISQALVDLFQDIGLDRAKFTTTKKYWEKSSNRRKFFETFAKNNAFDPLLAENWFKQSGSKIMATKGASRVKWYHNSSLSQALVDLFPETFLTSNKSRKHKLLIISKNPWDKAIARKKFFERFAKQNSFDPLIANNWYRQPLTTILSSKSGRKVVSYHSNSLPKALIELFPSVKFDVEQFHTSQDDRREFFIEYARTHAFDPLNPEEWYEQSKIKIMATKGAHRMMMKYGGSVTKALLDLYPDIGFDSSRFGISNKFWQHPANRRNFFEKFAKENGFDALVAHDWYLNHFAIANAKMVLQYHKNSVVQALIDLFPEIGLSPMQFEIYSTTRDWNKLKNRRARV